MDLPFKTDHYSELKSKWPPRGNVILASVSPAEKDIPETIILYQAYKPSIATYAVEQQTFKDCPDFSTKRMTWLKPNFLWMMYRSGWATKKDQERILAISVSTQGFKEILRNSVSSSKKDVPAKDSVEVRLQWDPDHDPFGDKLERRAIQLGIRGKILDAFLNDWIIKINDITPFVLSQGSFVENKQLELLYVPAESEYIMEDPSLEKQILLGNYSRTNE